MARSCSYLEGDEDYIGPNGALYDNPPKNKAPYAWLRSIACLTLGGNTVVNNIQCDQKKIAKCL